MFPERKLMTESLPVISKERKPVTKTYRWTAQLFRHGSTLDVSCMSCMAHLASGLFQWSCNSWQCQVWTGAGTAPWKASLKLCFAERKTVLFLFCYLTDRWGTSLPKKKKKFKCMCVSNLAEYHELKKKKRKKHNSLSLDRMYLQ